MCPKGHAVLSGQMVSAVGRDSEFSVVGEFRYISENPTGAGYVLLGALLCAAIFGVLRVG
jgi:hypothetical protein